MALKKSRIFVALCLVTALLYGPRRLFSCGPFLPSTIFTYTLHPDFPLEPFARGELGVLQPTYARSYLVVAYRYLSGVRLDAEEQKAVQALWQERLNREWNPIAQDWLQHWLDARNAVPGTSPPLETSLYRSVESRPGYFETYFNCPADAFKTAVTTLEARIVQFGADSPTVRDWVTAQDLVFANCSQGQHIPTAVSSDAPVLVRADRAYQIAAANFYAGNYDTAKELFAAIAQDSSSPWRQIASYLIARTLLRQALVGVFSWEVANKATLTQAAAQAESVLRNNTQSDVHAAAQRILNRILLRLRPETHLHSLAEAVAQKNADGMLKQSLWDYTVLLDTLLGQELVYTVEEKHAKSARNFAAFAEIRGKDDLTDWILTFQGESKVTVDYAVQKWGETSSLPWLVASLAKVEAGHPQATALVAAAEQVSSNSPAFPTIIFHRTRLLLEAGRKDQARELLNLVLSPREPVLPLSSRNLFLALRMPLSHSLEEWLTYAQRVPTGIFYDDNGLELPGVEYAGNDLKLLADGRTFFDTDATAVLNGSPLTLLQQAVSSTVLSPHLHRELALAAWVRSVLLEDEQLSMALVPVVATLRPDLKEYLNAYTSAKDHEAKQFAAVFLLLKFPGARPYITPGVGRLTPLNRVDDYRDNWWCRSFAATPGTLAFLDEAQKTVASEELGKIPSVDEVFHLVITWAKKKPDDPRVPEALHRAVKSARYGCTSSELSKQAFQLLHKRYPNSPWAKKTPYWF